MTDEEPRTVKWPVQTIRDPRDGTLYISVDCLMGFRNRMGPAGWDQSILHVMDHIIQQAKLSDQYGKDISP